MATVEATPTTPTKADATAADRLLKAACRDAIATIRTGHDPRPLLAVAWAGAALLLGEGAK